MIPHLKYALELYLQGNTCKIDIARIVKNKFNLKQTEEQTRKNISGFILRQEHKGLNSECEEVGIPIEATRLYWTKTKTHSILTKVSDEEYNKVILDSVADIVSNYNPQKKISIERQKIDIPKAIKATVSDMHVGLDPNPNGTSLFQFEYNEEIFKANLDKVFQSLCKEFDAYGTFDLLVIDDLGDGLDGWDGLTTRGGHKLDQNMNNANMFRVFVEGKIELIEKCIKAGIANQVIVRNVSNDNHSGSFASIANMTIKMLLERTYHKSDVEFYILERFMEHFYYGDHAFILTHGKDVKHMFKGLPYMLTDKATNFINDYIEHYGIDSKYIHLEKGDLHQIGYSRTKKFDYRNYMTFAPPSSWAQHNFGSGYSGYSIQVIPKYGGEISHCDYYFDNLKKKH